MSHFFSATTPAEKPQQSVVFTLWCQRDLTSQREDLQQFAGKDATSSKGLTMAGLAMPSLFSNLLAPTLER